MFDALCSWDNLLDAFHKAAKGKRGKRAAAAFEQRLEENVFDLQATLQAATYAPGRYTSFHIHEPKRRLISAAPFRDRVVHHALCNVIEPLFESGFVDDSYANRIGRGTHAALDRCQSFARTHAHALQCDIRQYFPSIDHAILRARLATRVRDARVMRLIDLILASGSTALSEPSPPTWFAGDSLLDGLRPRGLPIGNLTSQFWANCYLDPLDQFIKRRLRCPAYLRYVDDFILFHDDKRVLAGWHMEIVDYVSRLRLTLHDGAQARPVTEGVSFLGFRVFTEHRRLKRRKGVHFTRTLRAMHAQYAAGKIPLEAITLRVQAWTNHVSYANTVGLRKAILQQPLPKPNATKGGQAPSGLPQRSSTQRDRGQSIIDQR